MKNIQSLLILLLGFFISAWAQQPQPLDYVSTLVGTDSSFELSCGNTYPAVARPWGMNLWTPMTGRMGDGWTYTYDAKRLRGFKQTHQPSPWINDYGQFAIMPITGHAIADENDRASWFSHKSEIAKPHYYRVYLADYDIVAELAPTERAAMLRFTFPQADSAFVVVDAFDGGSHVEIEPEHNRIIGCSRKNSGGVPDNFHNFFVAQFDKPFSYSAIEGNAAIIGFSTAKNEKVHVKVASSFISPDQAMRNLKELEGQNFDQVVKNGADAWNDVLDRIEIDDDDSDNLRTFYSCLYRCLLFPHSFYEYDGNGRALHYSPYDGQVHEGYLFTGTGFWDTFRALFPLVNLVYPSQGAKMQAGWANAYREGGFLPEWSSPGYRDCMIGNNSAAVVADAHIKGLTDPTDVEALWEALVHGAEAEHPLYASVGRDGYDYYNSLGYVPYDAGINENAARTLEYAYDDWCIWRVGRDLKKPQNEIQEFANRAFNYRNVFDSEHKLMRGRNIDGTFQSPYNPLKWGDAFTEGNAWHYTWSVFHDPQGLIDLMGGKGAFVEMLDSVFALPPDFDDSYYGFVIHEIREMQIMNMGNYAHGNQPIQHMIYLYDYASEPWKTQYWAREVMNRLYNAMPDGYCGDEDNGQTSAWYVFSALGFYPVCAPSNQYALGSPLFKNATIHLENGNSVKISAPKNCKNSPYIKCMTIDGVPYDKNYITYQSLLDGSQIEIEMSSAPNFERGIADDALPYSFSTEK